MKKKSAVVKQLSLNVPVGVHEKLKEIAKKRNVTITCVVTHAIFEFIKKEMETE